MPRPLIDTGVLLALLDARDEHHAWAKNAVALHLDGFDTCEAVITEVLYHVRSSERAKHAVLAMIEARWLRIVAALPQNRAAIAHHLEKYHPRADYADACLLALHEQSEAVVWTTDKKDFAIYRTRAGKPASALCP